MGINVGWRLKRAPIVQCQDSGGKRGAQGREVTQERALGDLLWAQDHPTWQEATAPGSRDKLSLSIVPSSRVRRWGEAATLRALGT